MPDLNPTFMALNRQFSEVLAAETARVAEMWASPAIAKQRKTPEELNLATERDQAQVWSEWLDGSSVPAIARDYPLATVKRWLAASPPPIVRDDPRSTSGRYFWVSASALKAPDGADLPMVFIRMPRKPTTSVFRKALRAIKADLARRFPGAVLESTVMEGIEAAPAERMIKNRGYLGWSFDQVGEIQTIDPGALNPTPLLVRYEAPKIVAGPKMALDFERGMAFLAVLLADGEIRFNVATTYQKKLAENRASAPASLEQANDRLAFIAGRTNDESLSHKIAVHFGRREVALRYPDFVRMADAARIHFVQTPEPRDESVAAPGMA